MFRKSFLLFFTIINFLFASAQTDSSHLRISLLTCGTGDEIWETFGHTAVRVVDSVTKKDIVYNYGTFAFGPDFELQFMRGKLLYYVSYYSYTEFLQEYIDASRSVDEQLLLLNGTQKQAIYGYLKNNALDENKYYKYDFFFDNCATRIRDVFPRSLGDSFRFGQTIAVDNRITFRNIINQYFYRTHWERFGINILLGSRIDKVMTNEDIMFLPDFLKDGIGNATLKGEKIATPTASIIKGSEKKPAGINWALVLTISLSLLTIIGLSVKSLHVLGRIMSFLMLFITGLLGCLILVMWFGTDHQGCQNNFNLLWALPTNLFVAFSKRKTKGRYAIAASLLLLLALVLDVSRIQEMPLPELSPVLLSLLFIYGVMYKNNRRIG